MVDRVYKAAIPAMRRALEELRNEFSGLDSRTDWTRLRIEPLLEHARSLERMVRSEEFSEEMSRLRRGVDLFHSDLVYLKQNIEGLQRLLDSELPGRARRASSSPRSRNRGR